MWPKLRSSFIELEAPNFQLDFSKQLHENIKLNGY